MLCVEINLFIMFDVCVIWFYGFGDLGYGFVFIVFELKLFELMVVKFFFFYVLECFVIINGGMRMCVWYDIKLLDFESCVDLEGVKELVV